MRHIFFSMLLLFLAGCVSSKPNLEGQMFPLAIAPLESYPFAEAWVDGQQVRMAIDTGASQETVLFSYIVESMGGKIRGKGDIKTTNLDVHIYDNQPKPETEQAIAFTPATDFAGLIGWPVIRKFVWQLNYPEHYHKFSDSLPFLVRNSYTSMKLKTIDDLPHIIPHSGKKVVIDTGASYAVYLSKNLWEKWKKENPYAFITLYDGHSPAAGGAYSRECARASSFTLNGITFHDIIVAESFIDKKIMKLQRDIDIMLGQEAFKSYDVWFDGPNERIYFSMERKKQPVHTPLNLVGISFLPRTEGKLKYECVVLKDSIAWDVGLRTGDLLVSLNGRSSQPGYDLITYLTQTPGVTAYITIWRKGNTRTMRWYIPTEEELQPKPPVLITEEGETPETGGTEGNGTPSETQQNKIPMPVIGDITSKLTPISTPSTPSENNASI